MNGRTGLGGLGVVIVAITAIIGTWAFLASFVLEVAEGARFAPTLSSLGVIFGVVLLLIAAGVTLRARRWRTPYW